MSQLGILGAVGTGTGGMGETSSAGAFGTEMALGRQKGTPNPRERRWPLSLSPRWGVRRGIPSARAPWGLWFLAG